MSETLSSIVAAVRLWIVTRFERMRMAYRDVVNYIYLWSVIAREKKTDRWRKLNLRHNWFRKIGTIVNLREEDMGEMEMVRNQMVFEKMRPINDYLTELNLHEIVTPSFENVPEHVSYKIEYAMLFRVLSVWYIIKCSFVVYGLWRLIGLI